MVFCSDSKGVGVDVGVDIVVVECVLDVDCEDGNFCTVGFCKVGGWCDWIKRVGELCDD